MKFNDIDDDATRWLCILTFIYIYIYYMVMLRSTTGPCGRPVIEVAYEEIILSLHRGCMGDDSSRRVVGVSAWCIAYVWHTQVNTSVSSIYIYFGFSRYKNLYVLCFQIYKYDKRTLVDSDLVLAWWGSENVFNCPWVFKIEIKPQTILWFILYMSFMSKQLLLHYIYWFFEQMLLVYSVIIISV